MKEKTFSETAAEIAAPFLKLQDTGVVYVNERGRAWINNDEQDMQDYFNSRGEKYLTFYKNKKKVNGSE